MEPEVYKSGAMKKFVGGAEEEDYIWRAGAQKRRERGKKEKGRAC